MTGERVVRIRETPGGFDENNDPIPSSTTRSSLTARAVAPGTSAAYADQGRNGDTVAWTLYFLGAVDLTDDDELEVRGHRCAIRCLDWRSAYGTGRRGLVVLATHTDG